MSFIVKKKINNNEYYYLNENKRDKETGKVKTKSIAYLGKSRKEAELKAKEIIESMKNKKNENIIEKEVIKDKKIEIKETNLISKKERVKEEKIENKESINKNNLSIEDIFVFCKKKGFVFKSSEIYGGFAGFWDFGPLGVELFNNLKQDFWKFFVHNHSNMVGIDASIISNPKTWIASGHVANFNVNDYLVVCKKCNKSNKIDKPFLGKIKCECGGDYDWDKAQMIEQMFKTKVGALNSVEAYLRGETAQGMFMDFKQIYDTSRVKLPFGIVQIGRCFRNEIAPRDFLFRSREFNIGEFEFFIHPENDDAPLSEEHLELKLNLLDSETQEKEENFLKETSIGEMINRKKLGNWHAYWLAEQLFWFKKLGLTKNIKVREHTKSELSHYSSATFDMDYEFPFGSKEIAGNANRGQYDLTQHAKHSNEKMEVFDENSKQKVIPRVIEPTFGMERVFLALLCNAYNYDDKKGYVILKIPANLAPIKAAIFPIVKRKEFEEFAKKIYSDLKKEFYVLYDEGGSIGRRYARNDEIGTPYCITIDEDSIKNNDVTIRNRDTSEQIRIKTENLREILRKLINLEINFESLK